MKAVRLWQGMSNRLAGRIQIAESKSGLFFIRSTFNCSSGGAIRHAPRYDKWVLLNKKCITPARKFTTPQLEHYGQITCSQIGGAYRLNLPK